jgi:hypothetical protein
MALVIAQAFVLAFPTELELDVSPSLMIFAIWYSGRAVLRFAKMYTPSFS